MARPSARTGSALVLVAFAAVSIFLWLDQREELAPREGPATAPGPARDTTRAAPANAPELPEPDHHIGERGRLTLEADSLPAEGTLFLALDLPDEARGDGPRPVVIASTDGRRLETTAAIRPEAGAGVQIEVDPRWLQPGSYMISVSTAERTPLAVRRYVIEVR